jgi:flagellar hook-associated protein 3 FlgL
MRISSQYIADQFLASIEQTQSALADTEQQITTGKAFQTAGDNPIAASQAITLQSTLDQLSQYASNANLVQSRLSFADTTLASLSSLLATVRTTVVQASNSTLSNADRASLAATVSQQLDSLKQIANTQDGSGQYLFAGSVSNATPFVVSNTGIVTYQGDSQTRQIQIGSSRVVQDGDPGDRVFTQIKNGNGTFQVQAGSTTPPVTNTGSLVVGATSVTNPALYTGDTYQVAFNVPTTAFAATSGSANTGTGTIAPPVSPVPAGGGQQTTTITFVTATSYTLTTNGVTSAAQAYTPGGTISGGLWTTQVSGAPAAGDTFTVAPAQTTYTVTDTTQVPATTVVSAQPYTSGQTIGVPSAGISLNVTGLPANGDVLTVSPSSNQSLFTTLQNLITALNTPGASASATAALQNSLNSGLQAIDQAVNNVSSVRTDVGARLNAITAQNTVNSNAKLQLTKVLSSIQDADYAASITALSQQQTSLQAAEQSFVSLKKLSIFNFL